MRCKRVWCLILLSVPMSLRAQNPDNSAKVVETARANRAAVSKPARKPDQVMTNDSIGLLAVRRAPRTTVPPVAESTPASEEALAADAEAIKNAEIASLEKQIKDKQKRITLLMKLFVNDEKEFLKNAGSTEADPVAQERRRYEQDELRWETAEVAKLQARLEELNCQNSK